MNGFSPHLPWLYRQFLHFQRLRGVIWRHYSGMKTSHQANEDFMFLRHLILQFSVCKWNWEWQRELKCIGDTVTKTSKHPPPFPMAAFFNVFTSPSNLVNLKVNICLFCKITIRLNTASIFKYNSIYVKLIIMQN